jgi:sugar phosphate isomerase/epimerase
MDIPCVAANNDFSSPISEHRECQLLMVRELARLASDLGSKVVRLFAAWNGVPLRNGKACYDLVRSPFYTFERQYPYAPWQERWDYARDCLKEAAAFGEDFGVVMALQNHYPLIRHWKDVYDMVRDIDSPWLKVCLDLPMLTRFDPEFVREAALTTGTLQVHSHYGGEFTRVDGKVKQRAFEFDKPIPDYTQFVQLMREIGYEGYICYELCHPFVDDRHRLRGIDAVDEQVRLARDFMADILSQTAPSKPKHEPATAGAGRR